MSLEGLFRISNNSFRASGFPWGQEILRGIHFVKTCYECSLEGRDLDEPRGTVEIRLAKRKGSRWPDVLGCGAYPLFIISRRMLDDWREDGIGEFPCAPVLIADPLPKKLVGSTPPEYVWLDGERMQGARLDFDASGYVGVQFCPACGTRSEDISATHRRREDTQNGVWHDTFVEGTWNGANVFTTDLSPCAFFCTWKVVECARRHKHTNLRFIPLEAGDATWSKGLDYLGKRWPPFHALRCSDGKTLEQWLSDLRDLKTRYKARCALLDLGTAAAPALPVLLEMLREKEDWLKREAQLLLGEFKKIGISIGPEGEEAVRLYNEWYETTLGRYTSKQSHK